MPEFRKILFPTDFSAASKAALDHALMWAELYDAELLLLHVLSLKTADPFHPEHHFPAPEELQERLRQLADSEMKELLATHGDRPLRIREMVDNASSVERGILDRIENEEVDLVVLGTHGRRGPAHLVMGSVATEVLHRSDRPVLVIPARCERGAGTLRRILAPTDFSPPSREAAKFAFELARKVDAAVELFHVLPNLELTMPVNPGGISPYASLVADLEPRARDALAEMAEKAGDDLLVETHVWQGPPAATILERAAGSEADLIVIATQGHSGLDRLLLGSVTERVARLASTPVLALPARLAVAN